MKSQAQDTNICENFDNITALQVPEKVEIDTKEQSSQSAEPGTKVIPGRMNGLCMNCDDRVSCQFPIVDGGVWHCEEYC